MQNPVFKTLAHLLGTQVPQDANFGKFKTNPQTLRAPLGPVQKPTSLAEDQ